MNVFFVLLTTVSAGQCCGGPAVVTSAPAVASSCGGSCGAVSDCCATECKKPRRGLFSRSKKCDDCCDTCTPVCTAPAAAPASCCGSVASCEPSCDCNCEKPKRRLFSRKSKDCCPTACDTCGSAVVAPAPAVIGHPAPAINHGAPIHGGTIINTTPITPGVIVPSKPVEPIKSMPKGEDKKPTIEEKKGALLLPNAPLTPTGAKVETEGKNPFELARRHEVERGGRAADYSRLTGRLSFVHADGGIWVLRYAPLSEEDAFGGSVVLARGTEMNGYREGDLVSVTGQVQGKRGSPRLGGALYQVQSIRLVDRPQ